MSVLVSADKLFLETNGLSNAHNSAFRRNLRLNLSTSQERASWDCSHKKPTGCPTHRLQGRFIYLHSAFQEYSRVRPLVPVSKSRKREVSSLNCGKTSDIFVRSKVALKFQRPNKLDFALRRHRYLCLRTIDETLEPEGNLGANGLSSAIRSCFCHNSRKSSFFSEGGVEEGDTRKETVPGVS